MAAILLALVAGACDRGATEPPVPAALVAVGGDRQTGVVGRELSEPLVVRVVDEGGSPLASVTVRWQVDEGGGRLHPMSSETNGDGTVQAAWTLGTAAGAQEVQVSVEGLLPVTFTAGALPGPAARLEAHEGDEQVAVVGTAVPVPPSVRVSDAHGNPVTGETVTFVVAAGGGSVQNATATTDGGGVASVGGWTLGTTAGPNLLTAEVGDLPPLTFSVTGTSGAPAAVGIAAGDGQEAPVATAVPVSPSVLVRDAHGNPVPDAVVTFAVTAGSGTLSGSSQTTDGSGVAAVGAWTLGTTTGPNAVEARVEGAGSVEFTAVALPGPPAGMSASGGGGQSATVGTAVETPPAVRVRDAFENLIPGVPVTFTVTDGGGSVPEGPVTTDAEGTATVARWTLGTAAGPNRLAATLVGVPDVVFEAEGTPDAPAALAPEGDGQHALVGSDVPTPPAVLITDQYDNPVPGIPVTFAVSGGGGTVRGASATTDAQGKAAVDGWTLGPERGVNTLSATAPGLPALSIEAVGLLVIDDFTHLEGTRWFAGDHPLGRGEFEPDNVAVSDGELTLRLPAGTHDGGEVWSFERFQGGVYEARIRAAPAPGSLTAFFLFEGGSNEAAEIDIEILPEFRGAGPQVWFTTWLDGVPTNHTEHPLSFDPAAAFHTYRIDVREHGVRFYVDDVLFEEFTTGIPTARMHVLSNAWWPVWLDHPPPSEDQFARIDWIRF